MPKTDFFDDDLERKFDSARRLKMGPAAKDLGVLNASPPSDDVPVRPVSDFNLTRMAKHKEEVSAQVAHAMEELERLRVRQEDLEREKRDLEELRRRQQEYEQRKAEMLGHLGQSLVKLEKDQLQAEQLGELLRSTLSRFKVLQSEISAIHEDRWPESQVREELAKALTLLDETRVEYNKAFSRINALQSEGRAPAADHQPVIFEEHPPGGAPNSSFGHWAKIGLAASLPLIVTMVVLAILILLYQMGLLF
jgi:vacuolar-type H+-ATPase subunit I/STV1